ncbi:MAG: glycosyltransferase [Deltaproteobacteria bacterium]|nr:glycosyltransferase [Deltaproteobacteria bacterium]
MKISVVIPTLDESARIVDTLGSVSGVAAGLDFASEIEVIVVDGGSRDETGRLAREAGARVLESERGRARQLRMGAERSTGDVILFLHADTRLPPGWVQDMCRVLSDPGCTGGAFTFGFAERGARERWIEWWVALRVAAFGLPYGDQALFMRRTVLEEMGGVPIVPIMEDLDLVRGIKRAGRLRMLPLVAETSSRRYAERGGLRTVFQHGIALLGWTLGWDRERLAEWMGR